jgi:hypothetical protein
MKGRAIVVALVAAFAAAAAMTFSAASPARPQTTEPTKYRLIIVVLSDTGIKLGYYSDSRTHDGYLPVPNFVPRGDYVSFSVVNKGRKTHNFTVFGKKTKPIRPGGKGHLFTAAMVRGSFPYGSTLDKGKAFHGFLTVV